MLHEMTEAAARAALLTWRGADGLEGWIAEQSWRTIPTGWEVVPRLRGWRFCVEPISTRLRLRAWPPDDAAPAVREVLAKHACRGTSH
jgi:hypothetical protein